MGKVNACLKCSFITVNSLNGIMAALLWKMTAFIHGLLLEQLSAELLTAIHFLYAVSIITVFFTIIGVFGACKEKKWALILFAVGMILGSLIMLLLEICALVKQHEDVKEMKQEFLNNRPLTDASWEFKENLSERQEQLQCCGLDQGYVDWGYDIPESCICLNESTKPCVEAPEDSALFGYITYDQPIMIYTEPCLPHLIEEQMRYFNKGMVIVLVFTLFWVLSVVLCVVILCQLDKRRDTVQRQKQANVPP